MARKKVEEVKEEPKVVEEVKEEVKEETIDPVKEDKKARNSKILSEIKSFFIILLIIGLVILGGWAWYKSMQKHSDKNDDDKTAGYSYALLDATPAVELVDGYIIQEDDYSIKRIFDESGKMLYEGEFDFDQAYKGIDNNLYIIATDNLETSNVIFVNKLVDGKIEQAYKIAKEDSYFAPLLYHGKDGEYLIGFVGTLWDEYVEGETSIVDKSYFIDLENNESTLDGYMFAGNAAVLSVEEPVITYSDTYVTIKNEDQDKYGAYNYKNKTITIDTDYDMLFAGFNNEFVAQKKGKTGIISAKEKILVIFEYDFIDVNSGYYIIGKDKKLAIMNDKYEFVTGFDFKYQGGDYTYYPCCMTYNTFESFKSGDKYFLVTNYGPTGEEFKVNEAYFINSDGKFETVKEDSYRDLDNYTLIYDEQTKKYTLYDNDGFVEKFTIDLSSYAYDSEDQSFYEFGDNLGIYDKDVFFDLNTGREITEDTVSYKFSNVKIEYNNDKIHIYVDDKEIYSYTLKDLSSFELEEINNGFFIRGPEEGKDILLMKK